MPPRKTERLFCFFSGCNCCVDGSSHNAWIGLLRIANDAGFVEIFVGKSGLGNIATPKTDYCRICDTIASEKARRLAGLH